MKRTIVDTNQVEMEDKVVEIKRVTKVVKGGRTMRISALVVVGDKKGHVGAGLGKAAEVPEAIRKAKEDAMKHMITVPLDENKSIPHDFRSMTMVPFLTTLSASSAALRSFSRELPKVPVSLQAARHVSCLSLQVTRTFVRSPSARTTSATLFWQRWQVSAS